VLEAVSTAGAIALCVLWPSVLLFWLLRSQAQSRVYLASLVALTFVVLVVLSRSILGAWYVVGTFWPWVLGVAFLGILIQRARRSMPVSFAEVRRIACRVRARSHVQGVWNMFGAPSVTPAPADDVRGLARGLFHVSSSASGRLR